MNIYERLKNLEKTVKAQAKRIEELEKVAHPQGVICPNPLDHIQQPWEWRKLPNPYVGPRFEDPTWTGATKPLSETKFCAQTQEVRDKCMAEIHRNNIEIVKKLWAVA